MFSCLSFCVSFSQRKVKALWLTFNVLYGLVSFLGARLAYEYFIAHTLYLTLIVAVAVYNGGSFYIDVFAKRGLGDT